MSELTRVERPNAKRRENRYEWISVLSAANNQKLIRRQIQNGANIEETLLFNELYLDDKGEILSWVRTWMKEYQIGTPLVVALLWNRLDAVETLIEAGAKVNAFSEHHLPPLLAASNHNCRATILLIEKGADVNVKTRNGSPVLQIAIAENKMEFVATLLEAGADVNATDRLGFTALHVTLRKGNLKAAAMLLPAGADVNATDQNGATPLHAASLSGCSFIMPLIEKGASVNATDKYGDTPLHVALKSSNVKMAKTLIETGADINATSKHGSTPLHAACRICVVKEQLQIEELLIRKDDISHQLFFLIVRESHVNARDYYGNTPLHIVMENKRAQNQKAIMTKTLIERGADVNQVNKEGWTALHKAARVLLPEIIKLLLKHGADVNAVTKKKDTALHHATLYLSKSNQKPVALFFKDDWETLAIEALLERGADIGAVNSAGLTPLDNCKTSNIKIHNIILSWTLNKVIRGGDLALLDRVLVEGSEVPVSSHLRDAAKHGHENILRRLLEYKAICVNWSNFNQMTALHLACTEGHLRSVKLLLEYGASLKMRNKDNKTPLDLARAKGHQNVVEYIELWQWQRSFGGYILSLLPRTKTGYLETKIDERERELAEKEKEWVDLQKELDDAALRIKESLSRNDGANDANDLKSNMEAIRKSHITMSSLHSQIEEIKATLKQLTEEQTSKNNEPSAAQQETISVISFLTTSFKSFTDFFKQKPCLLEAIVAGDEELVDRLLRRKPDLNMRDIYSQTPLFLACKYNRHYIIRLLVDRGADVNAHDKENATPLYVASQNGYSHVVDFLLKRKADVNTLTRNDATPLFIAAENGHTLVVEALLRAGAHVNLVMKGGFTPLYVAARNDRQEVVQMLLEHGADVNASSDKKMSPLHRASVEGYREVVELLLEYGADTESLNSQQETPDIVAEQHGHIQLRDSIVSWRNTPQKERQRLIKENQRQRKERMQRLMRVSTEGTLSYLPILYGQLAGETLDAKELRGKLEGLKNELGAISEESEDKQGLATEIESQIEEVTRELASKEFRVADIRQKIEEYEKLNPENKIIVYYKSNVNYGKVNGTLFGDVDTINYNA